MFSNSTADRNLIYLGEATSSNLSRETWRINGKIKTDSLIKWVINS